MRKIACAALCAIGVLLFAGCEQKEPLADNPAAPSQSREETKAPEQGTDDSRNGNRQFYEKMEFASLAEGALVFAADTNGDVYVLRQDGVLTGYRKDGSIKQTYPECLDFTALCCDQGMLYAYDAVKREITALNTEDGSRRTVLADLYAQEVLKIVKLEDALYVLTVPENMQGMAGNHDYIDFGERVYQISLTDGKRETLSLDGVIAIYASAGSLYYYAYQGETYILGRYDPKSGESSRCFDMMAQFGIKYLSAFVFESDTFAYAELNTPAIHVLHTGDGQEIKKTDPVLLLSGNDMDCIRGNVVYNGYSAEGEESGMQSIYLFD